MSGSTAEVVLRVYGVSGAPPGGAEWAATVPQDIAAAAARVKEILAERGATFPYVLYLNEQFVPELLSQTSPAQVADGDEFTVFPVFSGG